MRIIKFRGQNIKGEWHYGFLSHNKDISSDYEWFISNKAGKPFAFGAVEKSIGQFTGLHDKNGKEIYECDIILFQKFSNWDDESMKRHKATVVFKEGCFMWEILKFGKKSVTYYANAKEPLRNTNSIWGLEVIGNIYENPELLEKKFAT